MRDAAIVARNFAVVGLWLAVSCSAAAQRPAAQRPAAQRPATQRPAAQRPAAQQTEARPSLARQTAGARSLPDVRVSEARLEDATLWDVHFVDPDQGWAVGDWGVILHTRDGGENWLSQASGTSASLRGVHFVDADRGWAVGGWYEAHTGLSRGVMLRTKDGGESWQPLGNDLPALRNVVRLDGGSWAVHGDWSHVYLGAVLETADGGVNWNPLDQQLDGTLATAALSSDGILLTDAQGVIYAADDPSRPPRTLAAAGRCQTLRLRGSTAAAVWDGGTVGISRDGGRSWQRLTPPPLQRTDSAEGAAGPRNWQAIAISDSGCVWFAGAPGDRVLCCEPDGSVRYAETGVRQPLYGLHFWDDYRGWAVGACGTILTTRDGGHSWRPQRPSDARDRRSLVLAVTKQPQHVPWAAIGRESLEFGRRVAVAVASPPQPTAASDPLVGDALAKTRQAALQVGVGDVMLLGAGERSAQLDLGPALRSYRPGVLVVGEEFSRDERRRLVEQAMAAGVARVYAVVEDESSAADVTLHRAAILPVAGLLVGDLWEQALAVLQPGRPLPERSVLRQLWDQTGAGGGRLASDGLASGLPALAGRWTVPSGRRRNLQVLQARSSEELRLDRLIETAAEQDTAEIRAALDMLIQQTPSDERSALIRRLLQVCRSRATEESGWTALHVYLLTLQYAAAKLPEEPLGRWAELRRTAIAHSTEWQTMLERGPPIASDRGRSAPAAVASHGSPFERAEHRQPAENVEQVAGIDATPLSPAGQPSLVSPPAGPAEHAYPAALYELAARDGLAWRLHPQVLAWKSKFGGEAMEGWDRSAWRRLGAAAGSGPWRSLAAPDDAVTVRLQRLDPQQTRLRPWLDGRLDDPLWRDVPVLAAGDGWTLQLAGDHEYYFLAIRGTFFQGDALAPAAQRQRDERLRDRPRVRCELDVDGDLLTRYVLTIDATGRTHDAVDGFPQWRPEWFVSTAVEEGVRTVEVAIDRRFVDRMGPLQQPSAVRQAGGAARHLPADLSSHAAATVPWRVRLTRLSSGEPDPHPVVVNPHGWLTVDVAAAAVGAGSAPGETPGREAFPRPRQ